MSRFAVPDLGVGVGFRVPHYGVVLNEHPAMDWFEVIAENFMLDGGPPLAHLARLQAAYPVVPHGVSMSLGDAVNPDHERRLLALLARLNPPWFSDHACWTGHAGVNTHDLVSITLTQGAGTPTVHSVSVAPGDVAEFLGIASGQWTVSNVVFDDSHVGTLIDSNGNASTGVVIVSDFQFDDLWALY